MEPFKMWQEVIAAFNAGTTVYYQAPLDTRAYRVTGKVNKAGDKIRIRPASGYDFTADVKHLDRFRRVPAPIVPAESRSEMLHRLLALQEQALIVQNDRNAEASADRDWSRVSEGKIHARKIANIIKSYRAEIATLAQS